MSDDFGRFHPVWNVPKDAKKSFELARDIFPKVGFGKIRLDFIDNGSGTLTASFIREGKGQPAVFAEYLAAQAYLAEREGLNKEQIKARLKQAADNLLQDEGLRQQVLEKSLATTATNLEALTTTTKIESEALGINNPKDIRKILEENLQDYFARTKGLERD